MLNAVINCTLVEFQLFGATQYFCLSGDVQWNGKTWIYLQTNPPIVTSGNASVKSASFQLPDFNLTLNHDLVKRGVQGVFGTQAWIKFYAGYEVDTSDPPVVQNVTLVFKGIINHAALGPLIGLELLTDSYFQDVYPKQRVTRQYFKYLIDDNTVERWNSQTYIHRKKSNG